jgi:hypothetical protein
MPIHAQKGDISIAPKYSQPRRQEGVDGQHHTPATFAPGYPLSCSLGRPSEPVITGMEKVAHTGIRSPVLPDRTTPITLSRPL